MELDSKEYTEEDKKIQIHIKFLCKDGLAVTRSPIVNDLYTVNDTILYINIRYFEGLIGCTRLIFGGKQLDIGRTLRSCGVVNDSILHSIGRLRGD